jgi:hypothetical protein
MRGGNVSLTGNQLRWLAGLLEGEGAFISGTPLRPRRPKVQVIMTDRDVIVQVADIFGVSLSIQRPGTERIKPRHGTVLVGGSAASLMKLLYSLMGERRQAQIDKALACYKPLLYFPHRTFHVVDSEMKEYDRYWLAGYLEGEGCFSLHKYPERRTKVRPQVEVDSIDYDVIECVRKLWQIHYGIGVKIYAHLPARSNARTAYRISVQNDGARTIMRDLYPLLSIRRRERIDEILQSVS